MNNYKINCPICNKSESSDIKSYAENKIAQHLLIAHRNEELSMAWQDASAIDSQMEIDELHSEMKKEGR